VDLIFNDRSDTARKLHGCVATYEGRPVLCSVDEGLNDLYTIRIKSIPGGRARTIQTTDPEFEARFLPLGYMNVDGIAVWLSRNPARRMALGIGDHTVVQTTARGQRVGYSIVSEHYVKLFDNDYPTFIQAVEQVMKEGTDSASCAFHRDFAIAWLDKPSSMRVYFKQQAIGTISIKRRVSKSVVDLYDSEYRSFIMPLLDRIGVDYVQID
jgi:hypothetical protein